MGTTGGFDSTDAGVDLSPLIQQIVDKLGEACTDNPINVQVCNPTDLTVVETALAAIQTSVSNIDANTDTVEGLLSDVINALGGLDSDDDGAVLANILTAINSAITELQAVDANTDGLEAALASILASITAEGDQTQALLTTINTAITAIQAKLGEDCTGAPINVNVCTTPKVDQINTIVHGQDIDIPAGLKSVTINNLSGITVIDGGFELGDGRRSNGISYSATELEGARGLLPAIVLAGGTWQWTGIQPIAEE